jgi:branched-chain amino acid aminotransferase
MKAYRQPDGTPALFRPLENARRFNRSARRMAMPPMPEALFLAAVETIVRIDAEWVPSGPDRSLYLRPFAFATEAQLGVRPALAYAFIVIASPVEPFFSADRSGVSVWVSEEYVRAVPGGTGEAKCAGNYAAGLLAQEHASENGCDQVLWLDSLTRTNIEEMGGMNVFFVENIDGESRLVTPALTGTLLAGVVRDSLIQLAQATGLAVEERTVRIDELRAGRFDEAFACGTAAVIAPIVEVRGAGFASRIGDGSAGDLTRRLRNKLLEIQYGVAEDPGGWVHRVEII